MMAMDMVDVLIKEKQSIEIISCFIIHVFLGNNNLFSIIDSFS